MQRLAETCERIAATTKKMEKTAIVAEYLRSRELGDAAISAVFLSGRAFPAFDERTLQIGGSLLWKLVVELTGGRDAAPDRRLSQARRPGRSRRRCAGSTALRTAATITLQEVRSIFDQIAGTRTAAAKAALLQVAAGARHCARSQVHPEDHHRRAAHRAEGEPGGRGHRQGLRRAAGAGAARQHAAGRHRRHAAAGGRTSARRGAHAAVSSHRLHAGQPGGRCGRSVSNISSTRWSRTSTTASARRRTAAAARCGCSRARSTK